MISSNHLPQLLWIKLCRSSRRTHQIAEHDRELPTFSGGDGTSCYPRTNARFARLLRHKPCTTLAAETGARYIGMLASRAREELCRTAPWAKTALRRQLSFTTSTGHVVSLAPARQSVNRLPP